MAMLDAAVLWTAGFHNNNGRFLNPAVPNLSYSNLSYLYPAVRSTAAAAVRSAAFF